MELISRKMKNPNHKWLVRSGLQKAIRRGDTANAMKCAGYLLDMNFNYLRRTLAIIAVEDIGMGNPNTTLQAVNMFRLKKWRGDDPVKSYEYLIIAMCEGVKSRAFCELAFSVELQGTTLGNLPKDAMNSDSCIDHLMHLVRGCDHHMSYVAVREIVKNKKSKAYTTLMLEVIEQFKNNTEVLDMVETCITSNLDGMGQAAFTVARLVLWGEGIEVKEGKFPESVIIKGLPSEALDMHVSTGKKAIKALHTSLSKKDRYIASIKKNHVRALGAIVFIVEGGLIDKRVSNPTLDNLKEVQDREFMRRYGVPMYYSSNLLETVEKNIPLLNNKRKWAVTTM